jgi:hypothetical protein
MKFKKLISSALLFLAAVVGIAPAHADYAAQMSQTAITKIGTTTVANTYAAQFTPQLSSFASQGPLVLPKAVAAVTPINIKPGTPVPTAQVTFIVLKK